MPYRIPLVISTLHWLSYAGIQLSLFGESLLQMIVPGVLAFDASAISTSIGVITVAIVLSMAKLTPAVAEFIKTCGPLLVELIGNTRKKWNETSAQVQTQGKQMESNTGELAEVKSMLAENRAFIGGLVHEIRDLRQINAALGEAELIGNGDMRDPIKEKVEGDK